MEKNQILQIAKIANGLFGLLLIGFYACFMGVLLVKSFWPEAFPYQVIFSQGFEAGWGISGMQFCQDCATPNDIVLSQLENSMKIWLGVRGSLFFVLAYLMIQKVQLILQTKETFYPENVLYFRQLSLLALISFGLSTFNFSSLGENVHLHLTIAFGPLAFSIACLVLSEIFKEGLHLLEDKNSIV